MPARGRRLLTTTLAAGLALAACAVPALAGPAQPSTTAFVLSPTARNDGARLTGESQGFSVETADFAHGYLTRALLADRLTTLGRHGVLRLGGYSMDLVWPAFGRWSHRPAPPEAIGGTVDQGDLDALKDLLDATGWKVTLGLPLKRIIDPSKVRNPAKDPSPEVTMDQVVAEVKAAHHTLGDDLLSVEVGNEFDNVTTLTSAGMWATVKKYQAAIDAALPHAGLKVAGPSANTSKTNSRLEKFVTAALDDDTARPRQVLSELTSHYYPGSHCGSSTMALAQLTSAKTYLATRAKLQGINAQSSRLGDRIPMTVNESNSASCSGQPGVSDSYATALWSLDYLLQTARSGVSRLQFHTSTAAVCGDFRARDSADYPVSYRYYGAFCARDQAALDAGELSATPLYYGLWAFRQVPHGRFVDLGLADAGLGRLRAYGVRGRHGTLTVVLINVQDPAAAGHTGDAVTLHLGSRYRFGRAVTLRSSDPHGLASPDASRITLGGSRILPSGRPTVAPRGTAVGVEHGAATTVVAPGTAEILTFTH